MGFRRSIFLSIVPVALMSTSVATAQPENTGNYRPRLLVTLPGHYNTPDGAALGEDGTIVLSIPNFNNDHLLENGVIKEPAPAVMAMIDTNDNIATWYEFRQKDMHPDTGRVGPMDAAFGPDGNLYVADMQVLWDGEHKSRLLRINVEDGEPVDVDVVVEGFIVANGMVWKGNTLFVTESVLAHTPAVEAGEKKPPLVSGVYAFSLKELHGEPIQLSPYTETGADDHLVVRFRSSNTVGFGADGVTVDDAGNLYTSIVEDGVIYRTRLDGNDRAVETGLFASADGMKSSDGIVWNPVDRKIYVADLFQNAVHSVDTQGNVSTLHINGDTDGADGSLDQPAEVLVRGNDLIIVNMDVAWLTPPGVSVNTAVDSPYTISVIRIQ
ncbi:MAG: SMP-30/gluconolactonase/LRE family protein [Pseudomonadota bacterium]|nr:SMP-30/gluconolactonase/LRE family protein [Pseudomonadota bacterium]